MNQGGGNRSAPDHRRKVAAWMIGLGVAGLVTHAMSTVRSVNQVRRLYNAAEAVQDEQFHAEVARGVWLLYPEVALIALIFLLTTALAVVGLRARSNPRRPMAPMLKVVLAVEAFVTVAVVILDLVQESDPLVSGPSPFFAACLGVPWLGWMMARCALFAWCLRMLGSEEGRAGGTG